MDFGDQAKLVFWSSAPHLHHLTHGHYSVVQVIHDPELASGAFLRLRCPILCGSNFLRSRGWGEVTILVVCKRFSV